MSTRRARVGAAALAFGGAAFGLIQIVQGAVGAFQPRPLVSALMAVSIGLAGAWLGRWRQQLADRTLLASVLRVWPLRRLGDTDPLVLGVFPPEGGADRATLGDYVPRDADLALDEALRLGGFVLVAGPAQSGKSRTTTEAARRVLGNRPVIVPVGGPELSTLLRAAPFTPEGEEVWWLDDLERFLEHLDGVELAALLAPERTVVATIREDAWERLLSASGQDGERGRRLLAAARIVTLPLTPSSAETADAERLYPGIDVAAGLGDGLRKRALASHLAQPAPAPEAPTGDRRTRDDVLALIGAAAVGAAIALGVAIALGGFSKNQPPPIGDQVDSIRQAAARSGRPAVKTLAESLHGADTQSYVFVLRPRRGGSDELQVYDDVDGTLRLRFDFQPRSQGQGGSAYVVQAQEQQANADIDYALSRPVVADYVGDGEHELIADYAPQTAAVGLRLPIIVAWDDREGRYRLSPLLTRQSPPAHGLVESDFLHGEYRLRNVRTPLTITPYPVSSYLLLPPGGPSPALLATAIEATNRRQELRLEVNLYTLDLTDGAPKSTLMCGAAGSGPDVVPASPTRGADYRDLLARVAPALAPTLTGFSSDGGPGCVVP